MELPSRQNAYIPKAKSMFEELDTVVLTRHIEK